MDRDPAHRGCLTCLMRKVLYTYNCIKHEWHIIQCEVFSVDINVCHIYYNCVLIYSLLSITEIFNSV